MRTVTGPELTLLQSKAFDVHGRVEVENVDGTWVDISDRWITSDISTDVDNPCWSAVFAFARDDGANTASLSPLRSDSSLNVDDSDVYAPLLTAGNRIRQIVAVVAQGATPTESDEHELFIGTIDSPKFGDTPMTVEARDPGGKLIDTIISEAKVYGDADDPVPVADVMQQILDDVLGDDAPTLVVADSSDYVVTRYAPLNIPVMEAMAQLAIKAGGLVARYRYGDDGEMHFTMYDPVREKTVPDVTLTPSRYIEIPQAALDSTNVRNIIRGQIIDPVTGELITITPDAIDTDSVAAFGPRFMQLGADILDGLTANEAATVMASARDDLSTPKFDHEATRLVFWPFEVGDLVGWAANSVHYNDAQSLAAMSISHHLERAHGTSRVYCRGKPAGGYLDWIRRQGTGPLTPLVPPAPVIEAVLGEADSYGADEDDDTSGYDGGVWVLGRYNKGCVGIDVYTELADGEGFAVDQTASTLAIPNMRRPDGVEGLDDNFQFLIRLSTRAGYYKRVMLVGRGASGLLSREARWPDAVQAVDPIPTPEDGLIESVSVTADVTRTSYAVTVTPASVDTTNTENWLVITRNGQTVFRKNIGTDLSPVTFLDTGLTPQNHQWDAFIWNNGVSGPKNRWVETTPTLGDVQFTLGPVARLGAGDIPEVYMEGTTGLAGADRMAAVKSLDQSNTATVGISSGLTPFEYADTSTGAKWYKLIAYSSVDPDIYAETPWRWWPGMPPTGSQGTNPPAFANGTPKKVQSGGENGGAVLTVLLFQWTCTTSGANEISIQQSDDNGVSDPWTEVHRDASVGSGEWSSFSLRSTDAWYRVGALQGGSLIAASAGVHYVP